MPFFKGFFLFLSLLVFSFCSTQAFGQSDSTAGLFKEIALKTDTITFSSATNQLLVNGESRLAFAYQQEDQVYEVQLHPAQTQQIRSVKLAPSSDYALLDSVVHIGNSYFRFKVKFKNLSATQRLGLTLLVYKAGSDTPETELIPLFPYTRTTAALYAEDDELYVGEEKIFELTTNNLRNLNLSPDWIKGDAIDYKVVATGNNLRLHVLAHALGNKTLRVKLQSHKPNLNSQQKPDYNLPVIEKTFTVKGSRIKFLAIDKKEITYDEESRTKGVEVLIEGHWNLQVQKTYRIEDQEQSGGVLIAELFTRNSVTSNKVLCWLRVFNYHRISEGYLYIKDGDQPRFITNFAVTPKTTIRSISIMHEGGDWTNNLTVYPGENIQLKIEGEGLHKARFQFDDLVKITSDSLLRTEEAVVYKLQVPVNIARKKISIYNRTVETGHVLTVKEHQRPRTFDFVNISYGNGPKVVAAVPDGPVFYDHVLKDVVFSFNPQLIDSRGKLYGRQYLKINVRVTNSRNDLIDQRTIEKIIVCPGDNSPRYAFYSGKDCTLGDISLNNILGRKTYDLDEWSRLEITIQHDREKHGDEGITKKIDLVLRRRTKFDIDVSFPAGLLVRRQGEDGFGDLGGISMAMIGQLSFYHPEKIARYRPYKIGAGFLALNAFNFSSSPDVQRDIGAVIIGALYPTTRDTKLTFPLYVGGGYFISKKSNPWFYFLGPGIRVRF